MKLSILNIAIIIFIVLESVNVFILYFTPDSSRGNGVAVFMPYFKAKEEEASKLFVTYLVRWVAGVKLIFIALLLVILLQGSETLRIYGILAMILSISTYYLGLHPIIKKLDQMGELRPKGYSKKLFSMISGFLIMFTLALVIYFIVR